MTKEQWLTCDEPWRMLYYVAEKPKDRKLRLFACACFRRFFHQVSNPGLERQAVEIAELYADGQVDKRELQRLSCHLIEMPATTQLAFSGIAAELIDRPRSEFGCRRASELASMLEAKTGLCNETDAGDRAQAARREREQQIVLIRDIFGNPFHSVTFSPSWRTDTALTLARQMYESREFGAMPILADALQDAGCDSEELLSHLRDASATHVRGCWALDLLLEKE